MNFPASLFITNNYDVIAKHFFSKSKLDTSLKNVDLENVVLITPENNKYLKSFEYSFAYENQNQSYVKLEFIDIDGRFEESFLKNSTIRTILRKAYIDAAKSGNLKEVSDRLAESAIPKIFFSFGIGDDLNNWSAPMVASFVDSKVEISSEGLRTILYSFAPQPCPLLTPVMDISQDKADKYSFMYHLDGNVEAYGEHVTTLEELENNPHIHIKKVLENYFAKVTNTRNQVLLFPDIGTKFKLALENEKLSVAGNILGIKNIRGSSDKPTLETPFGELRRLQKDLREFEKAEDISSSIEVRIRAIENLLSVLGICCNEIMPEPLIPEKENIAYSQNITDLILEKSVVKILGGKRLAKINSSNLLTLRFGIDTVETQSQYPTRSSIPDYFLPLKKFEEGFTQIMGSGFNDSFVISTENDLRILNFWKRKKLIIDSRIPAFIFGTVQAIGDYLYLQLAGTSLLDILNFQSNVKISKQEAAIFDQAYKLEMVEYLFRGKSNSSFNEQLPLSEDELAYGLRELVNTNKKVDIPLFTHNTSNSNILALRLSNSNTYINAMNFTIQEDTAKYLVEAIGSEAAGESIKNILAKSDRASLLDISNTKGRENFQSIERLYLLREISEVLKSTGKFPNSENEISETILQWAEYNRKNKDNISIRPGQNGKSSLSFQGRLYQHLRESLLELNIKTLPFFTISNAASTLFRPAMVISKRLQTKGVDDTFSRDDFISEMYQIVGYKHVISTSEAYSEFYLFRKIPNLKEVLDSRKIKEEISKTNKVKPQTEQMPKNGEWSVFSEKDK